MGYLNVFMRAPLILSASVDVAFDLFVRLCVCAGVPSARLYVTT